MNVWTRTVIPEDGIVQYTDIPAADGWLRVARDKSTPAEIARLEARPWSEQWRALRDGWDAYAKAFQCLTLPYRDPRAVELMADEAVRWRETIVAAMRAHHEECAPRSWISRVYIDPDTSTIRTGCLTDTPRSGNDGEVSCDFDGLFSGCFELGASGNGCDPYTWNTISWKGGVASAEENLCDVLSPAIFYMRRLGNLASDAAARGALQVLRDTRLNIVLMNVREAVRVGIEFPEELAERAADAAVRAETARWNDPRLHEAAAYFSGIAAGTAAVPIVAGAATALAAIVNALPGASGADPRFDPHYTRPWLAGTGPNTPPGARFDPGTPPGVTRPMLFGITPDLVLGPNFDPAHAAEIIGVPGFTFEGSGTPQQSASSGGAGLALGAAALAAIGWLATR